MQMSTQNRDALIALDDDPTGAQTMSGVTIALRTDEATVAEAAAVGRPVHIITNSRALGPEGAKSVTGEAARAAHRAAPRSPLVLRGDSTLRGHLKPEYDALREVLWPTKTPPLLLVPALPGAGRVTRNGDHLLRRAGTETPLDQTEYSRDPHFGYRSSKLLEWAAERSDGFFDAAHGVQVSLDDLRGSGASIIVAGLEDLAERVQPAVLAPDAVSNDDLELIADGYRQARRAGADVAVRCGPAFAGALSGSTATAQEPIPTSRKGVLLVCGSYVAQTTAQLERLSERSDNAVFEVNPAELVDRQLRRSVIRDTVELARRGLAAEGVAVIATTRSVVDLGGIDQAALVTDALAVMAGELRGDYDLLVTKGGITSATVIRDGLGSAIATVTGPVAAGVARWDVPTADGDLSVLVVPGNVGDHDLLYDLVEASRE